MADRAALACYSWKSQSYVQLGFRSEVTYAEVSETIPVQDLIPVSLRRLDPQHKGFVALICLGLPVSEYCTNRSLSNNASASGLPSAVPQPICRGNN